jgi:hypothetical protein
MYFTVQFNDASYNVKRCSTYIKSTFCLLSFYIPHFEPGTSLVAVMRQVYVRTSLKMTVLIMR